MSILNKRTKDLSTEPKPRSILGMLFNPDLGTSVRPIVESGTVFVNLIALIFVMCGLFPKNHPGLTGSSGVRLKLADVIAIAWQNVSFTRATLPQTLMFFAVTGSLVMAVLIIIIAFFSVLIGTAHADTVTTGTTAAGATAGTVNACTGTGFFSYCDSTQDITKGWFDYLFLGKAMPNYLSPSGQLIPQSSTIQTAFYVALAFYSNAILIVAAVILFYHLASMVVETAHHGVVMGKRANQIWAPIRLVVAVGLLVPVSGGLNCGQMIVIQIARWGSGLADHVWSTFVTQIAADSSQIVIPNTPYARKVVYDLIMMEACACAYNASMGVSQGNGCPIDDDNAVQSFSTMTNGISLNNGIPTGTSSLPGGIGTRYSFSPTVVTATTSSICGYYTVPTIPAVSDSTSDLIGEANYTAETNAQTTDLTNLIGTVYLFVGETMPAYLHGAAAQGNAPANDGSDSNSQTLESMLESYQTGLQSEIASNNTLLSSQLQQIAQLSSAQGWITAGAWFNTIARAQSQVMDLDLMLPKTSPPDMAALQNSGKQQIVTDLTNYQKWLDAYVPGGTAAAATAPTTQQGQLMLAAAGFADDPVHPDQDNLMDRILAIVDWTAQYDGVWHSNIGSSSVNLPLNGSTLIPNLDDADKSKTPSADFTLGVQFLGANPLAEIAYLGHANINSAYRIFDDYMALLGWGGVISEGLNLGANAMKSPESTGISALLGGVGKITGNASKAVGTIMGLISLIFFVSGFLLAYLLPLIPFFRFLFNILTWIVSILEAVVCMPLVALAHLSPEGDGLPGANGKTAYYFVFNIFLRPVLMVFGLMLGTLIFFITASIMNMLYTTAVVGTGGLAHGHVVLSRLVYSMLYVVTLYMCANSSFKMIEWLPEHAMKWMGGQALHPHGMGDPQSLAQPMTLASGYVDSGIIKGAGGLSGVSAMAARGVLTGKIHGSDLPALAKNPTEFMKSNHFVSSTPSAESAPNMSAEQGKDITPQDAKGMDADTMKAIPQGVLQNIPKDTALEMTKNPNFKAMSDSNRSVVQERAGPPTLPPPAAGKGPVDGADTQGMTGPAKSK